MLFGVSFGVVNNFQVSVGFFFEFVSTRSDGEFWQDICFAVSEEETANFHKEFMDANDAPSPNDAARPLPFAQQHAIDRRRVGRGPKQDRVHDLPLLQEGASYTAAWSAYV